MAMFVRFLFPAEESRMDLICDRPDLRVEEEREMAEWMIWTGLGSGGTRPGLEREVKQWSGKRAALHARRI